MNWYCPLLICWSWAIWCENLNFWFFAVWIAIAHYQVVIHGHISVKIKTFLIGWYINFHCPSPIRQPWALLCKSWTFDFSCMNCHCPLSIVNQGCICVKIKKIWYFHVRNAIALFTHCYSWECLCKSLYFDSFMYYCPLPIYWSLSCVLIKTFGGLFHILIPLPMTLLLSWTLMCINLNFWVFHV